MNLLPSATLILLFSGASAVSGSNVRGDVSGKGHQKEQVTRHLLNGQEPGLAEGPEDEDSPPEAWEVDEAEEEAAEEMALELEEDEEEESEDDEPEDVESAPSLRGRWGGYGSSYGSHGGHGHSYGSGYGSSGKGSGYGYGSSYRSSGKWYGSTGYGHSSGSGSYGSHFKEYYNKCCVNYHGNEGYEGHDYLLFEYASKSQCEQKCEYFGYDCYGYEYNAYYKRCEVWKVPINEHKLEYVHGHDCYIKDHY